MLATIVAEIESQRVLLRTRAGRAVAGGLAGLALLTVVGMALLWPGDKPSMAGGTIVISRGILAAEVTAVTAMTCPVETRPGCARVDLRLLEGRDKGKESSLVLPGDDAAPRLSPGDRIRVAASQTFGDVPVEPIDIDPTQRRPTRSSTTNGAPRCSGSPWGSSRSSPCSAAASASSRCSESGSA